MKSKLIKEFVIDGVIVEHLIKIKDLDIYKTKNSSEDYFLFICDEDNVLIDISVGYDTDINEIVENVTTYDI